MYLEKQKSEKERRRQKDSETERQRDKETERRGSKDSQREAGKMYARGRDTRARERERDARARESEGEREKDVCGGGRGATCERANGVTYTAVTQRERSGQGVPSGNPGTNGSMTTSVCRVQRGHG